MTEKKAKALANRALPCPFCGGRLVAKDDHHGWWVAHAAEPGPCFASVYQIMGEDDLREWNTRTDPRRQQAAEVLSEKAGVKLHESDLEIYSWPEVWGSTAGPFGGIGGAMMTPFQLTAFVFSNSLAAVFCGWKLLKVTERFGFSTEWERKR